MAGISNEALQEVIEKLEDFVRSNINAAEIGAEGLRGTASGLMIAIRMLNELLVEHQPDSKKDEYIEEVPEDMRSFIAALTYLIYSRQENLSKIRPKQKSNQDQQKHIHPCLAWFGRLFGRLAAR